MDEKDKQEVLKYVQEIYDSRGCSGVEEWINNYEGPNKDFLWRIKRYITSGKERLLAGLTEYNKSKILEMTLLERDEAEIILRIMAEIYNSAGGIVNVQKWLGNGFEGSYVQKEYLKNLVNNYFKTHNAGGKPRIFVIEQSEIERILDETIL